MNKLHAWTFLVLEKKKISLIFSIYFRIYEFCSLPLKILFCLVDYSQKLNSTVKVQYLSRVIQIKKWIIVLIIIYLI